MADKNDLVTLYYLGGLGRPGKRDINVTAGQRAFTLPAPGESLKVESRFADELERKHKYVMPNGDYVSCFTTDKRFAARVKSGLTAVEARTILEVERVPDVDFLAEAKKRGFVLQEQDAAKVEEHSEVPNPFEVEDDELDTDDELITALGGKPVSAAKPRQSRAKKEETK